MCCAFGTSLRPCLSPVRTDGEWTRRGGQHSDSGHRGGSWVPEIPARLPMLSTSQRDGAHAGLPVLILVCLSVPVTLSHYLTNTHTHTHIVSLSQNCGHFLNSFDFRTISLEGRTQGWPKPFPSVKKKRGGGQKYLERELGVLCLREVQRCMLMAF